MNAHADWRLMATTSAAQRTADAGRLRPVDARGESGLHARLPRLTAVAKARTNRLLAHAQQAHLVLAGTNLTSRWRHWRASAKNPVQVHLVCGDDVIRMMYSADDELVPADGFDWRALQGDSGLVAWSLRYEALVTHLQDLLGVALRPERVVFGSTEAPESPGRSLLGLNLHDESGAEVFRLRIDLPSTLLPRTAEVAEAMPSGHVDADLIPIPLRWQLGDFSVCHAELEELEVGDVLCVGSSNALRGRAPLKAELPSGAGGLDVVVANGVATVTRVVPRMTRSRSGQSIEGRTSMPQIAEIANATESSWDAEQLTVDLSFELGGTEMTVGDLRQLAPGYTFSLTQRLEESPVLIRANGRPFGFGELILVDDFLGVRITRFATHGRE